MLKSAEERNQAYQSAYEHPQEFWKKFASNFSWDKPFSEVMRGDFNNLNVEWFFDGQLNISNNCLDRHLKDKGQQTAIVWVPNDPDAQPINLTYHDLHEQVCRMANTLKDLGVKKGDRVCFYMGMTPELIIGPLACARIGAIHSVVFGGFSAEALAGRINDCQATILVCSDISRRGAKEISLWKLAQEALKTTPSIRHCLIHQIGGEDLNLKGERDLLLNDLLDKANTDCPYEIMNAEDPLFILYTSGSTGRPKGLLHTTAGYMVWSAFTFQNVFQMRSPDDLFWCTADVGWITGHTYMTYAPLLSGVKQVVFEGVPTYPDAGRFWREVDRLKVTHFYTAPTAIRALEACGDEFVKKYQLNSLKVLGSVGEPINEEAWEWYHHLVGKGRCPIVDTWWQTETGGIMISALAGVTPGKATFATFPLPGVCPVLLDESGKEIKETEAEGRLCMKAPWPGMARTVYGDHQRYRQTYFSDFPGYYFTGDGAKRDTEGRYRITGRIDDVINVSGHRIGTAEVEDAINQHPAIVESAVVGFPHDIKGQGIMAYVIPLKNVEGLEKSINELITEKIGAFAKADKIKVTSGLPKTRSGKIMRRILRKIAEGERKEFGDTSTLLNPEIIDQLL